MDEDRLKLMEEVVAKAGLAAGQGPLRPEVACRVVSDMCALCIVGFRLWLAGEGIKGQTFKVNI